MGEKLYGSRLLCLPLARIKGLAHRAYPGVPSMPHKQSRWRQDDVTVCLHQSKLNGEPEIYLGGGSDAANSWIARAWIVVTAEAPTRSSIALTS
jgi:hypothetical protein